MKLRGSYVLPGTPQQVWDLLTDPAQLAKLLPGCQKLEPAGQDRFIVAVKFALAAVSGSYAGSVELAEKKPPESLRMRMEGKGAPGFMKGEGTLRLAAKDGETDVLYDGEAQVGGLVAAVGQRMLEGAARMIIDQFFKSAAALLQHAATKP